MELDMLPKSKVHLNLDINFETGNKSIVDIDHFMTSNHYIPFCIHAELGTAVGSILLPEYFSSILQQELLL